MDSQKLSQIAEELKSNLLLNIYTLALPRNIKHMAIGGQVCFHRWLFANPVRPLRCTTGSVEPVNGINKNVSGDRLLPMTILTYSVD